MKMTRKGEPRRDDTQRFGLAGFAAIVTAAVLALAPVAACSKVECKTYCEKNKACFDELQSAFFGHKKADLAKSKQNQAWLAGYEKRRDDDHGRCMKRCEKATAHRNASKIEECLKKKQCSDYAACLKKAR